MFYTLTIFLAIASNLAFVTVVQATPLVRRDVIAPKIIIPNADTVWTVGHVETVTWETSDFPPDSQISNPIGRVILGHQANDSMNLDFGHPLASGFNLRDGTVKLTVPDVPPRDDYLIVLYGDSGNTSPSFTITKITRGKSSSSSSSSSTSNSASSPIPSGETPPPSQTPPATSSPRPQVLTAEPPTPTPSSTLPPASISYSSSSSTTSPVAISTTISAVPASLNSSGTRRLISTDRSSNFKIILTSSMAYAILFLLI